MKNNKLFLTLLFVFATSLIFAQNNTTVKIYNQKKLPSPTLLNMIDLVGYSLSEWKSKMNTFDFNKQSIGDEGQTSFSISMSDGGFIYEKYPQKKIQIIHTYYKGGNSFLDELVEDLEPFYIETHNKNMIVYGFFDNGFNYKFIMMRTSSLEIVTLERFKPKE